MSIEWLRDAFLAHETFESHRTSLLDPVALTRETVERAMEEVQKVPTQEAERLRFEADRSLFEPPLPSINSAIFHAQREWVDEAIVELEAQHTPLTAQQVYDAMREIYDNGAVVDYALRRRQDEYLRAWVAAKVGDPSLTQAAFQRRYDQNAETLAYVNEHLTFGRKK